MYMVSSLQKTKNIFWILDLTSTLSSSFAGCSKGSENTRSPCSKSSWCLTEWKTLHRSKMFFPTVVWVLYKTHVETLVCFASSLLSRFRLVILYHTWENSLVVITKSTQTKIGKRQFTTSSRAIISTFTVLYGTVYTVKTIPYTTFFIRKQICYQYNTFRLDTVVETHNHTFVVPSFQRAWLDWTVVSNITLLLIISIALQMTCYSVFLSVYHGSKWNTWVNTEATWVKG